MNCAECKDLLVEYLEGLLDEAQKQTIDEHVNECETCRAELEGLATLQQRLLGNGKALAQRDLENEVMTRIFREQNTRLKAATQAGVGLRIRRLIMKSPMVKLTAAAAVIVVAFLVIIPFGGGTVTFAAVIQPILNARTVIVDTIVGEDETGPVIHDIVKGSMIRRTASNMSNIMVLDLDGGRMLTFDPQTKGAAYIDIEGPLAEGTKSYLGLVREIVTRLEHTDAPVKELGRQEVDGRQAVGFQVSEANMTLTIWADPEKGVPIRIELLQGQSFTILKNIEFDVPVEDSLVSMEVPPGYALYEGQLDMSDFTEEDFTETLRLWTQQRDGEFPDSMTLEDLMSAPIEIEQLDLPAEEIMQLGTRMARGYLFLHFLAHGDGYEYRGKGVKLGDAEKAVFWYRPEGSATYRVVYGDLRAEDVAPEDLPE